MIRPHGAAWEADLALVREESAASQTASRRMFVDTTTHHEMQGHAIFGLALGFDVWIASNGRSRSYGGGQLGDRCLASFRDRR